MKHRLKCRSCHGLFDMWTYSLGMSDLVEYRCSSCPDTLAFQPPYDRPLSKVQLPRCPCGGTYSREASHRCPLCNAEFPMAEIKAQIRWWGTPDGMPGVTMRTMRGLEGEVFRDPGGTGHGS